MPRRSRSVHVVVVAIARNRHSETNIQDGTLEHLSFIARSDRREKQLVLFLIIAQLTKKKHDFTDYVFYYAGNVDCAEKCYTLFRCYTK